MTIMKPSEGEYTIFVSVDTTDVALDWSELNAMITFYVNDTDRSRTRPTLLLKMPTLFHQWKRLGISCWLTTALSALL